MGCDIHLWVEARRDGMWQMVALDQAKVNEVIAREDFEDDAERAYEIACAMSPYHDRAYGLFGMLAGVRWPYARKIAKPRGVPDDASDQYREMVKQYDGDGHSHTYLSVRDLLDYPHWHDIATVEEDYSDPVFKKLWIRWKDKLSALSDEERKQIPLDTDDWPKAPRRAMSYASIAGKFYSDLIPSLIELGDPDDVRLVMFFDN